VWLKKTSHARNEALDCRVYSLAALKILGPDWMKRAAANTRMAAGTNGGQTPDAPKRRRVLSKGVKV
jgi:phage terminase large subunit GpA-like protein